MAKKDPFDGPDHHDADILLKLYELRREPEMRRARDWATQDFRPSSAAEVMYILREKGSDHNRWLRQFITYYEMVGSLVHRGILDRDLLEDSVGEYVGIYTMFKPFLKELREAIGVPWFMANIERLVEESQRGRERMAAAEKRLAAERSGVKA